MESGSAVEWAAFAWNVIMSLVSLAMTAVMFMVFAMFIRTFWNFYSEGRKELPSMRVLVRRIYCRHRNLSYVKNRYGFRSTCCAGCGMDVNRNKRAEFRR